MTKKKPVAIQLERALFDLAEAHFKWANDREKLYENEIQFKQLAEKYRALGAVWILQQKLVKEHDDLLRRVLHKECWEHLVSQCQPVNPPK